LLQAILNRSPTQHMLNVNSVIEHAHVGGAHECQFDFGNAFRYIAFDVGARPSQSVVVIASMF